MRVFDLLSWLHPSQICYSDTDSVMRLYDTTNPLRKHPSNNAVDLPTRVQFGKGLGNGKTSWRKENLLMSVLLVELNHIYIELILVNLLSNKKVYQWIPLILNL